MASAGIPSLEVEMRISQFKSSSLYKPASDVQPLEPPASVSGHLVRRGPIRLRQKACLTLRRRPSRPQAPEGSTLGSQGAGQGRRFLLEPGLVTGRQWQTC